MSPAQTYIINSIITAKQLIARTRPFANHTDADLMENLANVQEEIASKGGIDTMGKITRGKYELEIDGILEEMSYRN